MKIHAWGGGIEDAGILVEIGRQTTRAETQSCKVTIRVKGHDYRCGAKNMADSFGGLVKPLPPVVSIRSWSHAICETNGFRKRGNYWPEIATSYEYSKK